jgi:septation ring formation regulator EzrA
MKIINIMFGLILVLLLVLAAAISVLKNDYKQALEGQKKAIAERDRYDSLYRVANGKLIRLSESHLWNLFKQSHPEDPSPETN